MLTLSQWNSLLHLLPSDFTYPDRMQFSIVKALDDLIGLLRAKPQILSDYREPDPDEEPSQHWYGVAVDPYWPTLDPLIVWNTARSARLFRALGIYKNEQDIVSFHFDQRTNRTVDNPALWSGDIIHPYDPKTGKHIKMITYYAPEFVLDYLKKKTAATLVIVGFAVASYVIYRLLR